MKRIIISATLVIFFGSLGYFFLLMQNKKIEPIPAINNEVSDKQEFFSILNGLPVAEEKMKMPQTLAVMIDNHPDARPQSGLSAATVIYEIPVEGDLTRYMAIFDVYQNIEKVGPVRSSRRYFLDYASEYGRSLYMHSGGSPEALEELKSNKYFDFNEFSRQYFFWRDRNLSAPHNLFTKSELWNKFLSQSVSPTTSWTGFNFGELNVSSTNAGSAVDIKYRPDYSVQWKYDGGESIYKRYVNSVLQSGREGEVLKADNVVVQYVRMRTVDEVGRKDLYTTGEGSVRIVRDGKIVLGVWKKEKDDSRTKFFDNGGNEIMLKPGVTWLQIVPDNAEITVTN